MGALVHYHVEVPHAKEGVSMLVAGRDVAAKVVEETGTLGSRGSSIFEVTTSQGELVPTRSLES